MNTSVRVLHNPRCSKSRKTMEILGDQGVDVEIIDYLKQPPSIEELSDILNLLNMQPRELMRKHEQPYKDLNLENESLSRDALLKAMVETPILIERPIVINGNRAQIGRPPEKILDLLTDT